VVLIVNRFLFLILGQHEENLIRFGVFASDAGAAAAAAAAAATVADASSVVDKDAAAAAEAAAIAAASAASGDALDEPAMYMRAVAANVQAGKKV